MLPTETSQIMHQRAVCTNHSSSSVCPHCGLGRGESSLSVCWVHLHFSFQVKHFLLNLYSHLVNISVSGIWCTFLKAVSTRRWASTASTLLSVSTGLAVTASPWACPGGAGETAGGILTTLKNMPKSKSGPWHSIQDLCTHTKNEYKTNCLVKERYVTRHPRLAYKIEKKILLGHGAVCDTTSKISVYNREKKNNTSPGLPVQRRHQTCFHSIPPRYQVVLTNQWWQWTAFAQKFNVPFIQGQGKTLRSRTSK